MALHQSQNEWMKWKKTEKAKILLHFIIEILSLLSSSTHQRNSSTVEMVSTVECITKCEILLCVYSTYTLYLCINII